TERLRFGRTTAWLAGGLSGLFGGLVGNQGGIRSAALLGFDIEKESFVATATAIALVVDGARMPVYIARQHHEMAAAWMPMILATAGVLAGTFIGVKLLRLIPENVFRRAVGVLILALGAYMFVRAIGGSS
ncbi:MAG TPA: TSUP family transporter, partial [Thermoanaerobaculia bacterium]